MCGIAGLVRFGGLAPDERDAGAAMAATLRHRGPDDIGACVDDYSSLGHARLSIIDIEAGHQPMANEDGTVQVVFNGEIYNHKTLAAGLRDRGHVLATRCDTEVIAHLYEDEGEAFVHQLNGMFAIAIWDARRRRLVLVRDRMGIKPLYWYADGRRIVFGSELKAILAAPMVPREVDPRAIKDYLTFGHVPAPLTIYRGIWKLEPGCMLVATAAGAWQTRYWDIPFGSDAEILDGHAATQAFAELLDDSVHARLEADVPLGAFLSGGVDSAAVVASMCSRAAGPVLTHTVGFDESGHDERDKARRVATQLGTDHREVLVRADAICAAERLAYHFDEPFASPSAVPALYLAEATRQRVTVALAGDGPDEMLAGYRRYRFDLSESLARAIAPAWLRRGTLGVAGWLYPKADWLPRPLRAKRTLQNLATDHATGHLRSIALAAGELPGLLLAGDVAADAAGHDPFARGRELFARCAASTLLDRFLYLDMKTLLADEILTKVDRTSMAVGLEVRVPMLDHRLVELATRLSAAAKLGNGEGKAILRKIVGRRLGTSCGRTPKHGFDVPTDVWFRGPLRERLYDTVLSRSSACRDWIDMNAADRLVRHHLSGAGNHGWTLWTLLTLEQWADANRRQFCENQRAAGLSPRGLEPCVNVI